MKEVIMKKILKKSITKRTCAFLLTLVMVTGIVGTISTTTASGRTAIITNTRLYSLDGNHRNFANVSFQVSVNGRVELNTQTGQLGGFHLDRAGVPNGSRVEFSVIPPEKFEIHRIAISMNRTSVLLEYYPTQSHFSFITHGDIRNISFNVIFKPIVPETPIEVLLDGTALEFDVPPQVTDGRTLVPLRAIFEALGAEVNWNADTQTVTGTRGNTTVVLPIGSTTPTVNGETVPIDVPGTVVNGRTLVPLRFVAESFGVNVNWNAETRVITITS